MSRLFKSKF